ncbi:hypothetical protein [Corticicoccus populi]|uniref:Uncharacterized protein n=1 Tax=Corticicoccus populi TaxID=1812821 RepID=A0ABW5WUC2_9STAP
MPDSNERKEGMPLIAVVSAMLVFPVLAVLIFTGIISLPMWVGWLVIGLFVIEVIMYFAVIRKIQS